MEFNDLDIISYGYDLGEETIEKEYKSFSFNLCGLNMDVDTAIKICENNKFEFELNNKIIPSIEKYFEYYSSKYMSGYFNAKMCGQLFIGPDDWGYFNGIPFQGEIDIQYLTKTFYFFLKMTMKNDKFTGDISDFVKINITKINYDKNEIDKYNEKINPLYTKYLEDRIKHNEIIKKQREEYNNWKDKYAMIQRKLVDLLNGYNDTRIQIIKYIKELQPDSPVIPLLESNNDIVSLIPEDIAKIVCDKNNPYYWASEWKEYMCLVLRNQRPDSLKIINLDSNIPFNLINSITNMLPYWLANNKNINLYMIRIDYIYNPDIMDKLGKWLYKDKYGNFVSCTRIIKPDGEPANLPD
jgi:hypothetical protein